MDEDRVVKAIVHYQQNLEKYIERRHEPKMIYCMEKLQKLPITVSHLEHTGVGRTVNSVRKMKGIKGSPKNIAKQLVQQWKKMVTEEENDSDEDEEESDQDNDDDDDDADSEDRLQIYCENDGDAKDTNNDKEVEETRNIEMQDSSHYEEKYEKYRHKYSEHKYCDNDRIENNPYEVHLDEPRVETTETRIVQHTSPDCNEEYSELYANTSKDNEESFREQSVDVEESVEKIDNNKEDEKHKKHKKSSRERSVDRDKHKDKHKEKHISKEREKEKENHHQNGHKKSSSSSSSNNHDKHKDKHSKSSKTTSSSSSSSRKESDNKDKEKDQKEKSSRDKSRDSKRRSSTSTSVTASTTTPTPSSSSSSSSSSKKRPPTEDSTKNSPSKKLKLSIQDGIDCESGASFAEALGMMIPSTSKVKREKERKEHKEHKDVKESSRDRDKHGRRSKDHKSPPKEKDSKSRKERDREHRHDKKEKSNGSSSSGSSKREESKLRSTPAALAAPPPTLTPLEDVGISNLLPQISTNYKPLGFLPGDGHRSGVTRTNDDEMLSKLMYAKNQRTKVYSGNKVFFGKVPSLFENCIRLLQDNLDTLVLGYTGGVPYSILKPVLERATASQLFSMEHHNIYLMEDSDELWKLHCQREFKTKTRNEMETWREMYLRCIDERDAKLKSLTANIKLSQDKSLPVRQTKLAYVDSMAKPPRSVAKKQAKNGISLTRPAVTPSSRLQQLAAAGAEKVSVPNPGASRVNAGNSSSGGPSGGNNYIVKPKKAPLMAKTLQLLKGRFGRR